MTTKIPTILNISRITKNPSKNVFFDIESEDSLIDYKRYILTTAHARYLYDMGMYDTLDILETTGYDWIAQFKFHDYLEKTFPQYMKYYNPLVSVLTSHILSLDQSP